MPLILSIESTTNICSVALSKNKKLITLKETDIDNSHSKLLSVFIEKIITENNLTVSDLDAIAVSKGPGSYTGLRIGVSLAKGLCYGANLPLISINTLKSLAFGYINKIKKFQEKTLFCPMIDARRMEVYYSVFNIELEELILVAAKVITENSFSEILNKNKVHFFGNGAIKCQDIIKHKNAVFNDFDMSASFLSQLAYQKYLKKDFEDIAYFEPFYLKNFIAIPSKNKVF